MRLIELEPHFLKISSGNQFTRMDDITTADGIVFLCPKCFAENKGTVGTHSVICWRPVVPVDLSPGPGRWELTGTNYNDLTMVAGSSSILLKIGCQAHFFVKNGEIIMC